MCENNTNFYFLKDGKFRTSEVCVISMSIVISIVDMYNKKVKENYSPQLGDLIMEVLYQDDNKNSQIKVYKIESIFLLADGSKVLQLKPGASKEVCENNDIMIIANMLKTKAISLYTKTKSDTFYKSTYAYDKLPEDFATIECNCLDGRSDKDTSSCNEGKIEEVVGSNLYERF